MLICELVFDKYKITEHTDEELYVFVLSEANPPHGPDTFKFFWYAINYSLEYLGSVSPGIDLVEADIKGVSYPGKVHIGNKTYEFE
ncbi:hypothetical protein SYNTR_2066 [Candidatus Syntrophocurvum alkaliphilum]|uniref:Uncharacterized protein n=2 Tax=Candidatus Syntrophocurvum alkaliphilum TaxID=2293317 RepID=A0A6I6DLF7_9FIRM|nr:hypothetical protein SYNTR_2066 [Candidatus Syntrophocurvum alkaliphilum]